jgi:predicted dehydrogenase
MTRRRLRAVIVGCGKIAGGYDMRNSRGKIRTHIKAYRADRRFEVVAACDQSAAKVKAFCRHWKVPRAYTKLNTMLAVEKPDVVSVCTPTRTHAKLLAVIARHRVRCVFAEKPLTDDPRKARRIVELYRRRKIALAVNYLRRWCPNHRRIQQIISSGRLGKISSVDAYYSGDLLNIGAHLIDLIIMLVGRVIGVQARRSGREGELFLEAGAVATLERGKVDDFVLELLFDRGFIKIAQYGYAGTCRSWKQRNRRPPKILTILEINPNRPGIDTAMRHAVKNIGDAVLRGEPLGCDGQCATATWEVMEALRGSASRGCRLVGLGD